MVALFDDVSVFHYQDDISALDGGKSVGYDEAGAAVTAGPVEVDGNVITSRGMGTSIPFGLAIAGVFCGQDKADACAHAIVFQP